ncbi:MAG: hypothetical protein GC202_13600 [Alphaproteobacteria bacterium]|nr:hypothetical protein [Alphaproteobacteria bacterium]
MADQQFNVSVIALGGVQVVVIHVDAASCSTTEMQARSMKFFQARFEGKQVVLMYVDLMRKPVFIGPGHIVQALRGKGLSEFKWQKAVVR